MSRERYTTRFIDYMVTDHVNRYANEINIRGEAIQEAMANAPEIIELYLEYREGNIPGVRTDDYEYWKHAFNKFFNNRFPNGWYCKLMFQEDIDRIARDR